jgi:predicted GTPase
MMTIVDKLSKDVHLLIEGEKATKSNAVSLEESLEKQEFEIVQSNEPILANGNFTLDKSIIAGLAFKHINKAASQLIDGFRLTKKDIRL